MTRVTVGTRNPSVQTGNRSTATTIDPATQSEVNTGTETAKYVSPATLQGRVDTDGTLAANSDVKIPSQKAVKTYVDANGGGHVIEASGTPLTTRDNLNFTNGLTASDNDPDTDVKLGGALTEHTLFDGAFDVKFGSVTPIGYFSVEAATQLDLTSQNDLYITASTGVIVAGATVSIDGDVGGLFLTSTSGDFVFQKIGGGDIRIQDDRIGAAALGIQYTADYSANYTSRSLIDKGYADGAYWSLASGGTLTGNNTITGAFTVDFQNKGLIQTQTAQAASWSKAILSTPGAHTSLTAATEFISRDFGGASQQWLAGTVATQRFNYFRGFTVTGASATATFTLATTVQIDTPVVGANAGITNNYGLHVGTLGTGANYIGVASAGGGVISGYAFSNITGIRTAGMFFIASSGELQLSGSPGAHIFTTFYTGTTERARVSSIGNFLIGSTTDNARLYAVQSALAASWIPAFRVDPGAHTSLTAATAFPNQVFSSATQSWVAVAGTIAAQKDTEFRAITHSAATSGTFTDLYNVFMEAPAVGGSATATRRFALGLADALQFTIGTTVASNLANTISLSAKDSSDGAANATLALYCEQAVEAIGTFTESHKLKIWVNGTEYWISLDAV